MQGEGPRPSWGQAGLAVRARMCWAAAGYSRQLAPDTLANLGHLARYRLRFYHQHSSHIQAHPRTACLLPMWPQRPSQRGRVWGETLGASSTQVHMENTPSDFLGIGGGLLAESVNGWVRSSGCWVSLDAAGSRGGGVGSPPLPSLSSLSPPPLKKIICLFIL